MSDSIYTARNITIDEFNEQFIIPNPDLNLEKCKELIDRVKLRDKTIVGFWNRYINGGKFYTIFHTIEMSAKIADLYFTQHKYAGILIHDIPEMFSKSKPGIVVTLRQHLKSYFRERTSVELVESKKISQQNNPFNYRYEIEDDHEVICKMYVEELTPINTIAEKYNCTSKVIKRLLKKYKALSKETKEKIAANKSLNCIKAAARKTPEEKAEISAKRAKTAAKRTPEEKAEIYRKVVDTKTKRSPEEKELTKQKHKDTLAARNPEEKERLSNESKERWKNMPPEKKLKRREKIKRSHDSKSDEEKLERSNFYKEFWKNMPQERKDEIEVKRKVKRDSRTEKEKTAIIEKRLKTVSEKSEEELIAIQEKRTNVFRYKIHTFADGVEFRVQGYENLALRDLEILGFKSNQINVRKMYKYTDLETGNTKSYFADIHVDGFKTIEVKSIWYLKVDQNKNRSILTMMLNQNEKFEFWVYDKNETKVIITTMDQLERVIAHPGSTFKNFISET